MTRYVSKCTLVEKSHLLLVPIRIKKSVRVHLKCVPRMQPSWLFERGFSFTKKTRPWPGPPTDREIFINWYFFRVYMAFFTKLVRVLVAAIRKSGMRLRGMVDAEDNYYGCKEGKGGDEDESVEKMQQLSPPSSKQFKYFFSLLILFSPLPWTGILCQNLPSLSALSPSSPSFSSTISLILVDLLIYPFCMAHLCTPTLLQHLGIGHYLNCTGMVASALVEARQRAVLKSHGLISSPAHFAAPMSALWLVLPFALIGLGEAFHFSNNIATAALTAVIGLEIYLSTAVVDLLQHSTNWLPNNINAGLLDNVYWTLNIVTLLNFGYFLVCAS
ncbi:hypothetical protein AMTRI_Chr08g165030 [Amborella trichopoda]